MSVDKKLNILNKINPILTLDTDWAPDYVIDYVSEKLERLKIKATWFITHNSPAIKKLKNNSLFEIGLHPNFANNSTQGDNVDDILKKLKEIVPNAESIRTHGLLQSSEILLKFKKFGIKNDTSILFHEESCLRPHYSKYFGITRFPYYWEDDIEMISGNWKKVEKHFFVSGLKIFDFHPIHIFLNSKTMKKYNELKKNGYPKLEQKLISNFINPSIGVNTFFENFILKMSNSKTYTIKEISKIFDAQRIKAKK